MGIDWIARHGLTSEEYQAAMDQYVGTGYRPTNVCGYGVGDTAYYAAIWDTTSVPDWIARHGLTSEEYQAAMDQYVGTGYRPTNVCGYGVGDTAYYAAIWEKS